MNQAHSFRVLIATARHGTSSVTRPAGCCGGGTTAGGGCSDAARRRGGLPSADGTCDGYRPTCQGCLELDGSSIGRVDGLTNVTTFCDHWMARWGLTATSGSGVLPDKVLVALLGEGRKALQDLRADWLYLYGDTEDICADAGQQTVVAKALETPDQV